MTSAFWSRQCARYADPHTTPKAKRFDHLSYFEVLNRRLGVMDVTAISMCMENRLPIIVFNLRKDGNIVRAVRGESIGTMIDENEDKAAAG